MLAFISVGKYGFVSKKTYGIIITKIWFMSKLGRIIGCSNSSY